MFTMGLLNGPVVMNEVSVGRPALQSGQGYDTFDNEIIMMPGA